MVEIGGKLDGQTDGLVVSLMRCLFGKKVYLTLPYVESITFPMASLTSKVPLLQR